MITDPFQYDDLDPSLPGLSPDDAGAIDAIFDRVSNAQPERVEAAENFLSLIAHRSAPEVDRSLVDATLARVARVRRIGQAEAVFGEADSAAIDALVGAQFDASGVPALHAQRAGAAAALLNRLSNAGETSVASGRAALIAATLSRVDASEAEIQRKYRLVPDLPVFQRRFQFGDLVGVAAALLLGVSVIWPMLNEVRASAQRTACQANLASVGAAFGAYANEYSDSLPLASPSNGGNRWCDIGTQPERSNAANLFTLVRTGYSGLEPMACSTSPSRCRTQEAVAPSKMDWRSSDDVSYSFQIQFGRAGQARLSASSGAVLVSDRSPVIVRALRGELIDPFANSMNHAGAGQNVLLADGVVQWIKSPVLTSGDNIWLPRSTEMLLNRSSEAAKGEQIRGNETPESQDVFVGP